MTIKKRLVAFIISMMIGTAGLVGCGTKVTPVPPGAESEVLDKDQDVVEEPEGTEEENSVIDEEDLLEDEVYGEADPTATQEVYFVITDGIETAASTDMSVEMFQDTYGISNKLVSSYTVKTSMMNVHASEIAIFEVRDEGDLDEVRVAIEKRKEDLEKQWSNYLPDQYELVKEARIVVKGKLVLFIVDPNANEMIDKFEAQF